MLCPVCGTKFVDMSDKTIIDGIVQGAYIQEENRLYRKLYYTCIAGHTWEGKSVDYEIEDDDDDDYL